ncbi:MAG: hypothetical protein EOP45_18940 [Sphingobacteriaceae bacterium]|nr:MAG: hypothetical protein EOP45_18940 [Sphingobacteriaceae bacterium]
MPKDQLNALYTRYLKLKEPRPCLIERTFGKDFPLFFDVDYKLAKFCAVVPQTEWEEQQNMDKNFTLEYTFGQEGVKEWFLKQQRIILRITEEVVQETTNRPVIHSFFSVRTCYKYHIYIPEVIVNETIAAQMCKEIVHRWTLDAEYVCI